MIASAADLMSHAVDTRQLSGLGRSRSIEIRPVCLNRKWKPSDELQDSR